ncbi:MAG: nucleotidyltransferase domain-containing protein [Acetobacteraceae bacterium]
MDRAHAIARLQEHEAELKQLGVQHLYLFGSTARGDAPEDHDFDRATICRTCCVNGS